MYGGRRASLCAILGFCSILAGCGGDEPSSPLVVGAPRIVQNPNPSVPLAAIVELETAEPTRLSIEVGAGDRMPVRVDFDGPLATSHHVPLLGFHPGEEHSVVVRVEDAAGRQEQAAPLSFEADPLPDDFPPITIGALDPSSMEPGATLFNVYEWDQTIPGAVVPRGLLVALDEAGEVVWYLRASHTILDARRLENGHILYEYDHLGMAEVDMLGNVVAQWHATNLGFPVPEGAIPVKVDTMHHEVTTLPDGHLLTISTERRVLPDYPTSDVDPASPTSEASVIGDVIVELDRDGSIVHSWSLFDMLDPRRIGYDSLAPFWDVFYPGAGGGTKDWTHANAVVYSDKDDAILVSLRNQDAIVKFSRATGELAWILGPPENWAAPWQGLLLTKDAATEWPYHQHAPELGADGSILLFDNGNFRASPFDTRVSAADNHSRAVELRVDEATRTVTQTWAYGGADTEIFYAPFVGDADRLPRTGNVLITDGGRVADDAGVATDAIAFGHKWSRILEVTREASPRKVFEATIGDPSATGFAGWTVYRADRLPSLQP